MAQRDLLINQLKEKKLECPICYDIIKNIEPIWNCKHCYQIIHVKCITLWFKKSCANDKWWCPICQKQAIKKPEYLCFCGKLVNPVSNSNNIPHSCGQTCKRQKINANAKYKCKHKCTLLCHPGPCPPCTEEVLRYCDCHYVKFFVECGQSSPIICKNICSKQINCLMHVCEKTCHIGECDKCVKCPKNKQKNNGINTNNNINQKKKNVWLERFLHFMICIEMFVFD